MDWRHWEGGEGKAEEKGITMGANTKDRLFGSRSHTALVLLADPHRAGKTQHGVLHTKIIQRDRGI